MAEVEKININSTDYDIADAKALRNKSTTNAYSFIDTKAGTSQYPTTGESLSECNIIGGASYVIPTSASGITILGRSSYASGSAATVIGNSARAGMQSVSIGNTSGNTNNYTVNIGCNSTNSGTESVAVGETSYAASCSTAVGRNAQATTSYTTALGWNAYATSSYSIALGASVAARYQHSICIGYGANASNSNAVSIGSYAQANYYSVAIGRDSYANSSFSVQLGNGTNNNYGSLQFRNWPVVDSNGKIYEERFPDGIKFALTGLPSVELSDDSKQIAALYVGETIKDENDNDVIVRDLCYRTKINYSKPSFYCGWVNTDYMQSTSQVYIDQQKFFEKLAEVSRGRIDDGDVWNSVVGGDNSEQDFYLYYDGSNSEWRIEISNSSIESMDNQTPDAIWGITDIREYGIYITGDITLPDDDEEIIDIYYYAPIYCDGYDCNDSSYVNIDYMKFMNTMCDSDYGFGYVTGTSDGWEYSDGTDTRYIPNVPKEYEWDGNTYDTVEVRFEWNGLSDWTQYINGEYCSYDWGTNELASQFGIYVEAGQEESVEYIGFTWKPARQIAWEQFNPINESKFATATAVSNLQSALNVDEENKMFKRFQSARDLDTMTTAGQYRVEANGSTNLPTQAFGARFFWLFVTNYANLGNEVRQVLIADHVVMTSGGGDYSRYAPNIFVRCKYNNIWSAWKPLLTDEASVWIPGFKRDTKQMLVHTSNNNTMLWEDVE